MADQSPEPARQPVLRQAPVRALDADGVAAFATGTAGFAVASVVLATRAGTEPWHLAVAVVGAVIGLGGTAFTLLRQRRRPRA